MGNDRKTLTENQEKVQLTEVGYLCPKCYGPIFYKKNDATLKNYELAHIYPLNATPEEIIELKGVEKLSNDLNDVDNFIILCKECHRKYDNLKTREEYLEMVELKKSFIRKRNSQSIFKNFLLEEEIFQVINKLNACTLSEISLGGELTYDPKSVENKIGSEVSPLLLNKIKNDVALYYLQIKSEFLKLDGESEIFFIISAQIKGFYLKLYRETDKNKKEVFDLITDCINLKTGNISREACQIIVSFFIQNCEVF